MPRKTNGCGGTAPAPCSCFNEAAARCRGKRAVRSSDGEVLVGRFNEAAARCRGKPAREPNSVSISPSLQ